MTIVLHPEDNDCYSVSLLVIATPNPYMVLHTDKSLNFNSLNATIKGMSPSSISSIIVWQAPAPLGVQRSTLYCVDLAINVQLSLICKYCSNLKTKTHKTLQQRIAVTKPVQTPVQEPQKLL